MRVLQSYVAELLGVKLTRLKELNTDEIQIDSEAIVNGAICKLFESWQVKFIRSMGGQEKDCWGLLIAMTMLIVFVVQDKEAICLMTSAFDFWTSLARKHKKRVNV